MRQIRLISALALVAFIALALACGDDDGGDDASPTGGTTATETTSPGETATPTDANGDDGDDGVDETTPPDDKTPIAGDDGDDDGNGEPSGATSDATPAPQGIPATHIPNIAEWLSENHPGVAPAETDCTYNPATLIATCDGVQYAVNPPLTGEDVACFALNVNNEPVAIRCTSQQPLTTIYYEIQG